MTLQHARRGGAYNLLATVGSSWLQAAAGLACKNVAGVTYCCRVIKAGILLCVYIHMHIYRERCTSVYTNMLCQLEDNYALHDLLDWVNTKQIDTNKYICKYMS